MTPFIKRNLLRVLSVLFLAALLYILATLVSALVGKVQHLEIISISIMVTISLVVMMLWGLFGVFVGLAAFLFTLISLYKSIMALNPYYYSVLIFAYTLSGFIGYHIYRKISSAEREYAVTMEKVQEDINLIRNHMESREAEVSALGEKIGSLLKLKRIADRLILSLDPDEIGKIVTEETYAVFGENKRVLLFVADDKSADLRLSYTAKGESRSAFARKNGGMFDRWVFKNMKSLLVKDVRKDFRFSAGEEEDKDDAVSLISKPLVAEGNAFGVLRVDSPKQEDFEQLELRILDIIGELAAVSLDNARLYKQTKELAIRDSLTGLYVHKYFMERLEEEVKRGLRSDTSFAFLMMDIDDFKIFNDNYGHIAGDAVLRNIGEILKAKASPGDIVARYGGEEFAFLLLNCNRKDAIKLANDIRKEVEESFITIRRKKYSVTISIGVSVFPDDAKLREDILGEADRWLYKAKEKGKNTVCSK